MDRRAAAREEEGQAGEEEVGAGGGPGAGSWEDESPREAGAHGVDGGGGGGGRLGAGGEWRGAAGEERGNRGGNGTSEVTWDNKAQVKVTTTGFDEKDWVSANYVAKITGLLFNDLTGGWALLLRLVFASPRVRAPLDVSDENRARGFVVLASARHRFAVF